MFTNNPKTPQFLFINYSWHNMLQIIFSYPTNISLTLVKLLNNKLFRVNDVEETSAAGALGLN